jgi:hypothetical protein
VGGVDWIQLARERNWWRTLVTAGMNLGALAPEMVGQLLTLPHLPGNTTEFLVQG